MINLSEIIGVRLPKQLVIKGAITVNGNDFFGRVTPYAMRNDKNGYPHFYSVLMVTGFGCLQSILQLNGR